MGYDFSISEHRCPVTAAMAHARHETRSRAHKGCQTRSEIQLLSNIWSITRGHAQVCISKSRGTDVTLPTLDHDHEVTKVNAGISDANAEYLAVREGRIQSSEGRHSQFQVLAEGVHQSTDKLERSQ